MAMNFEKITSDIIPRLRDKRGEDGPPISVTIAPALSKVPSEWNDFESLLEKFLDHVLVVSHPSGRIRIGVYKKKTGNCLHSSSLFGVGVHAAVAIF